MEIMADVFITGESFDNSDDIKYCSKEVSVLISNIREKLDFNYNIK